MQIPGAVVEKTQRRAAKTLKELPADLLPDILALIDDERVARMIVRADPDTTP